MINRINNNDYYDYSKLKMPNAADKTENGEAFNLSYQRAQERAQDKDKKDKTEEDESVKAAGKRTVTQGGVKLELSDDSRKASGAKPLKTGEAGASGEGIIDILKSLVSAFVSGVKDFFYKVWNDPVPPEEVEMPEDGLKETQEPERQTEEYYRLNNIDSLPDPEEAARQQLQSETARNKEIQQYLRSGNLERVLSLVTDDGRKTMAKNSTLLTYYDRTGRITPISASDQERILHGDRNVKKL